jgi:hypothetical protein
LAIQNIIVVEEDEATSHKYWGKICQKLIFLFLLGPKGKHGIIQPLDHIQSAEIQLPFTHNKY